MTATEAPSGGEREGRYAVIGHPVAHSRSPWIHARFAAATGQRLSYGALDAPPEAFAATVRAFFAGGGHGLNVTVPHKQAAHALAGRLGAAAREAGAVNTLRAEPDGTIYGDNTDGAGLLRDLTHNHGLDLAGLRILLLGAGGAARGVLGPLLRAGPARVLVINRTPERAHELAATFGPAVVEGGGFDRLEGERTFDLILHATSAGLAGEAPTVPAACMGPSTFCYDMLYGAGDTPFLAWARTQPHRGLAQGTGMLVEQAAESFALWRGMRPPTGEVLRELERLLLGLPVPHEAP